MCFVWNVKVNGESRLTSRKTTYTINIRVQYMDLSINIPYDFIDISSVENNIRLTTTHNLVYLPRPIF